MFLLGYLSRYSLGVSWSLKTINKVPLCIFMRCKNIVELKIQTLNMGDLLLQVASLDTIQNSSNVFWLELTLVNLDTNGLLYKNMLNCNHLQKFYK